MATSTAPAPPVAPPLTLVPAQIARAALVATLVAPRLDRALESGVALARKASPLPLDAAAVREMAFSQLGVPSEIASQLDLSAPVSGAVVGFDHDPVKAAFVFHVKQGVDVSRFLASLGTLVERRGPVSVIDTRTSGRGWFLPAGNAIVFADSEAALVQAGNLALEARRAPAKDDVSVVIYPDGVARASNTDVKTASARLLSEIEERSAATGNKLGPEGMQQLRDMVAYAADISTVELALALNVDKGVTLLARLRAKAGSNLEGASRTMAAVPIDPLLFGKDDAGVVVTSAYGGRTLAQLRRQRARLPGPGGKNVGKDVVAAGNLLDALADGLTGTLSMVGRLQPELSLEMAYPVKDAAAATKIQTALQASDRAAVAMLVRAETTGANMEVKVLRAQKETVGKLHAFHWTLSFTMPGDVLGIMKKLIGKAGLDVYGAIVGGDRLVFTMGPGAKARLAAMSAGKTGNKGAAPGGAKGLMTGGLAEATTLGAGRSLYYYVDLREGLAVAKALGPQADPRLQMVLGMLKAPVPILGGVTGDASGRQLTLDLTVPPSCIAGVGGLFGAMMGAGGPPGGAAMAK